MKQAFRLSCAVAALLVLLGALAFTFSGSTHAQSTSTASPTPDPFVFQVSSSCETSLVGDVSGDGRFAVIESTGDIATEKIPSTNSAGAANANARNNEDRNREIFLYDYAQRRIFQITNTKSAIKPTATPTPTPSPVPACSPALDTNSIAVEVSNNRPMISNDGHWIVFSSNAVSDPRNFDGNSARDALAADGNQEIWLYHVPDVPAANLSSGADQPFTNLSGGEIFRITNTTASRLPLPGTTTLSPFVADDNRDATIATKSDGTPVIAFVSTRNVATNTSAINNTDGNPEVFIYNRATGSIVQVTNTTGSLVFNENPSLSDGGTRVAYVSNGNQTGDNNDDGKGNGNGEIFKADFNTSTDEVTNLRQLTHTKAPNVSTPVNVLNFGRRLSRDGLLIAFESSSDNPKDNNGTITNINAYTVFIYNLGNESVAAVGPRPASGADIRRYPTFTDYDAALNPRTLVFTSALNFRPDSTFPTTATDGLNATNQPQIFSAPLPFVNGSTLTRLTNNPVGNGFPSIQPFTSNTRQRMFFNENSIELGGGNSDSSAEAFYLLQPTQTADAPSGTTIGFTTGASNISVTGPSPSPSASPFAPGVAPGELTIVRSNIPLAPADRTAGEATFGGHVPALPVELNGVSVSVRGAAAGLFFVGNNPGQINFVVPPGLPILTTGSYPVVINNNGTVLRATLAQTPTQPDIFTSSNGNDGRARVFNTTNPLAFTTEPFSVTSANSSGQTVPTVLTIFTTGVRFIPKAQVTVTIGTTTLSGDAIVFVGATDTPGMDVVVVTLPASLAGAGDVPVIITATPTGGTAISSRPADTAPHITINP